MAEDILAKQNIVYSAPGIVARLIRKGDKVVFIN